MNSSFPSVSVVVLSCNQERYIRETLESVLNQDYPNLEIVVSDDGSTDKSFEIIKELIFTSSVKDKGWRIVLNKNDTNLGICGNLNKAYLELATGEYILKVDGDDVCNPDTVSFAVRKLSELGVDSMSFNMQIIDAESRPTGSFFRPDVNEDCTCYNLEDYIEGRHTSTGACRIFKKDVFAKFGPFLPEVPADDTTLLLRTFLCGSVGWCNKPNHNYRIHGENISSFDNMMKKIDPQGMYNQYKHDIDYALGSGIITADQHRAITNKIETYLKMGKSRYELYKVANRVKRIFTLLSFVIMRKYTYSEFRNLLSFSLHVKPLSR